MSEGMPAFSEALVLSDRVTDLDDIDLLIIHSIFLNRLDLAVSLMPSY